jgi:predicted lipid-binding transport protein (Tim44 family)
MLFGGGLFHGITGFGGFLGFLIQIFLIVMVVRFLIRRFMPGASPAMAGGGMFARMGMGTGMTNGMAGGGAGGYGAPPPLAIAPADYQAFEQTLKAVQGAWSAQNIAALQQLATPEMVSYFGEQLAEQSSRGVHNVITDVTLDQGDLSQAWSENGRDYATVAMKFSMIDVTTDMSGRVVDGDPRSRVQATELWTFLRAPGGRWVLSAIQQAS